MNQKKHSAHPFEPSVDDFRRSLKYGFDLDRRKFFKMVGGGLAVAILFEDLFSFAGEPAMAANTLPPGQVGAWIHIGEDDKITVYTGKVEVGQNIRTSLAQVVAEELRV